MESSPRICVIIPVYNHGLTVQAIVREAKAQLQVIAVDDGSTDRTASILAAETGISVVTLPRNQGKAAALLAGFERARELGYSHSITIDADGQHSTGALGQFANNCRRHPEAMIIGVRDLKAAGAPFGRRFSNALSNFWFRFETDVYLKDTQCGYRVYPLAGIGPLRIKSSRYAFELEILVKAAWAGLPLVAQPVETDYAAPTSRLSHFHPLLDFVEVSCVHARLATQASCLPARWRRLFGRRPVNKTHE